MPVVKAVCSDSVPRGVEMWETCCGGYSASPIPILTRVCLKSALHMGLLNKISLKQRASTAKTLYKKSQSALEANIKGLIPYGAIFSYEHSLNECTKYLQYTRQSQNAFESPSATPKMNC